MDSGTIPFIGATDSNNGITNWIKTTNKTLDKNVLGVNYNGSVVESFYHPYNCIFSDDVKRLHLKYGKENQFVYLFLSTAIKQQKIKFSYGYKFNQNRMNRQIILLPVDDFGNPDYSFMENYIKSIMVKKYNSYISYCNKQISCL